MPRKIFKSPEITGMLDRLKMTNNNAMGLFSSMIKASISTSGDQVDLNEFTCSTSTIRRNRKKNRSALYPLVLDEFKENKPPPLNLHWDGKQIANYLTEKEEYEATLVSGAPAYIEGRRLSVSKIKN